MHDRRVGRSGLVVSAVGLGCNNFGERIDAETARQVVHRALNLGITFFDTADTYGGHGGSEEILGTLLSGERHKLVIATKFGDRMGAAPTLRGGGSRRYIMAAVEASLRRLKTDWIDLYQLHRPDASTPIDETVRALEDLTRQGKIRYVGLSNCPAWQIVHAQWTARTAGLQGFISSQEQYNLLWRKPEREQIPAMARHGLGLLPFAPLGGGFLSGKYVAGHALPAGARLTYFKRHAERYLTEDNWQILTNLQAFCQRHGRTMLELAVSWLLANPMVPCFMAGASTAQQIEQNVRAAEWPLTTDDLAEIDRLTAAAAG